VSRRRPPVGQSRGPRRICAIAFCVLVAFQWFNALKARSDRRSLFKLGVFSNRLLLGGILLAVALQMIVVSAPPFQRLFYTGPLFLGDWAIVVLVVLVAGVVMLVEELRKLIARRIFSRDN
jgi:Ca2+-transporting ATPase